MNKLSREFKAKVAGMPMAVQLMFAPISRDQFRVTAVTMLGSKTATISRDDIRELHGLCNDALCTDGPEPGQ